jgi:hypothetical protein
MLTNFTIQGDAWTWWQGAVGRYQRGVRPEVGSVLVFRRTERLHYGHVSVVSRVVDNRTILVDHSWLEGDTLHRGMKVIDTSPNNSWSQVRVWYEPSDNLGLRAYPTFGFIYPHGAGPGDRAAPLAVAARDDRDGDSDDQGPARGPRTRTAMLHGGEPAHLAHLTPAHLIVAFHPTHKPSVVLARAVTAPMTAPVTAQHRKPEAAPAARGRVDYSEVPQVAIPRHKPGSHVGHGGTQVADAGHLRGHDSNGEIGD